VVAWRRRRTRAAMVSVNRGRTLARNKLRLGLGQNFAPV
jgi:hypothetical protein